MAQIITYPKLSTLANNDLLLVSDVSSKNKNTNSLEVDTLAQYIITTSNVITGSGTLNYVPIFTPTGIEIGDSQLQQSPQLSNGLYQMKFNNADRFIINKPSSVTQGDPEYLIQQDGLYKVSFGWDDDGGGFGFIYNWAGNGLRLGAAGQNPQFELNTVVPKIISHTDHEFEGAILDVNGLSGTTGQVLSSTGTTVEWINAGGTGGTDAETVEVEVKNVQGSALVKGDPVYISGSVGASGRLEVQLADASDTLKMPAVGLLKQDLANNGEGFAVVTGKLRNLITDPIDGVTPTEGDVIYVKPSATPGASLTTTKPVYGNFIQNMGKVGRVSASNDGNFVVSSILRTNDIPNLTPSKIWVGSTGNTIESTVVHIDEANTRVGIGTSSPASRLEVDGGDIEVDDSASGLILRSPDGTRYRVTVANGGTLSVSAV